ncbi:hypothetical protein HY78_18465 [Rhizorhabdus wittichii DC-6]|nr:hypothetical protein HY78_18465 [Rhizorhabdus wittichii DC-6]
MGPLAESVQGIGALDASNIQLIDSTTVKAYRSGVGGKKGGAALQAIGRSRGGRATKIHAVTDGRGGIIAFELTAGQLGDLRAVTSLIGPLPPALICAADTASDDNGFRHLLSERGTLPDASNNPTRKQLHLFDQKPYKLRNLIERAFCFFKDWRHIATRYDKLAVNFEAVVAILWWR